jgi:hypothetical protein
MKKLKLNKHNFQYENYNFIKRGKNNKKRPLNPNIESIWTYLIQILSIISQNKRQRHIKIKKKVKLDDKKRPTTTEIKEKVKNKQKANLESTRIDEHQSASISTRNKRDNIKDISTIKGNNKKNTMTSQETKAQTEAEEKKRDNHVSLNENKTIGTKRARKESNMEPNSLFENDLMINIIKRRKKELENARKITPATTNNLNIADTHEEHTHTNLDTLKTNTLFKNIIKARNMRNEKITIENEEIYTHINVTPNDEKEEIIIIEKKNNSEEKNSFVFKTPYSGKTRFATEGELDYYEQNISNADYQNLTNAYDDESFVIILEENHKNQLEETQKVKKNILQNNNLSFNLDLEKTDQNENNLSKSTEQKKTQTQDQNEKTNLSTLTYANKTKRRTKSADPATTATRINDAATSKIGVNPRPPSTVRVEIQNKNKKLLTALGQLENIDNKRAEQQNLVKSLHDNIKELEKELGFLEETKANKKLKKTKYKKTLTESTTPESNMGAYASRSYWYNEEPEKIDSNSITNLQSPISTSSPLKDTSRDSMNMRELKEQIDKLTSMLEQKQYMEINNSSSLMSDTTNNTINLNDEKVLGGNQLFKNLFKEKKSKDVDRYKFMPTEMVRTEHEPMETTVSNETKIDQRLSMSNYGNTSSVQLEQSQLQTQSNLTQPLAQPQQILAPNPSLNDTLSQNTVKAIEEHLIDFDKEDEQLNTNKTTATTSTGEGSAQKAPAAPSQPTTTASTAATAITTTSTSATIPTATPNASNSNNSRQQINQDQMPKSLTNQISIDKKRKRYKVILEMNRDMLNVFKEKTPLFNEMQRIRNNIGAFTINMRNSKEILIEVTKEEDVEKLFVLWPDDAFGVGVSDVYVIRENQPELMLLGKTREELNEDQKIWIKHNMKVKNIVQKTKTFYDLTFETIEQRNQIALLETFSVMGTAMEVEKWIKKVFILQCYKCQKYWHKSADCKKDGRICRYCGFETKNGQTHESQYCHNTLKDYYCSNCRQYGHEAGARDKCPTFMREYNLACEKQQIIPNDTKNNTIVEYLATENVSIDTIIFLKAILKDNNMNVNDFTRTASKFLPKRTIEQYIDRKKKNLNENTSQSTETQSRPQQQSAPTTTSTAIPMTALITATLAPTSAPTSALTSAPPSAPISALTSALTPTPASTSTPTIEPTAKIISTTTTTSASTTIIATETQPFQSQASENNELKTQNSNEQRLRSITTNARATNENTSQQDDDEEEDSEEEEEEESDEQEDESTEILWNREEHDDMLKKLNSINDEACISQTGMRKADLIQELYRTKELYEAQQAKKGTRKRRRPSNEKMNVNNRQKI